MNIKILNTILEQLKAEGASEDVLKELEKFIADEQNRVKVSAGQAQAELDQARAEGLAGHQRYAKELQNQQKALNDGLSALNKQLTEDLDEETRRRIQGQILELEAMEEQVKQREEFAQKSQSFLEGKGLVVDFDSSPVGKFLNDMPGAFEAAASAMGSAIQPANLFAAGVMQMMSATKDLMFAFDDASTSLIKQTGTTGEYNDLLYDLQESNKMYGVTVGEAGEAIGALHTTMAGFNQLGAEQQATLATTTAQMKAFGVEGGAAAKSFDNMIEGMGMSVTEANNVQQEMIAMGGAIGVSAGQMTDDFNKAAFEIAKYGPGAIDVFKGMAAAAKSTGVSMDSLMQITKQFDTFEGAAQSAGKLNAILGGGVVNSMDLLNATEEERVRLLIQSVEQSGKNWENLNRFEKQAIASAAGIQDMSEANKIFSQSLGAYDEMQAKAKGAEAEQAKLEERAAAGVSFQEKLTMLGQSFAVAFMPLLEFLRGFMDTILMINDATGGLFIPVLVGLIGVVALLSKATAINNAILGISNGIMAARATITAITTGSLAGLAGAETGAGGAAGGATAPTLAMGAAIKALMPPPQLVLALLGIGAAFLGIGLAVAGPLIALAMIVMALKDLFIVMLEAPKAIGQAVIGMLGFAAGAAAAMVILAVGLAYSVAILAPWAPLMYALAPALMLMGVAMGAVGAGVYLFAVGLNKLAEAVGAFADISFETLTQAAISLALFAAMLIPLALPLALATAMVGIPLFIFALSLQMFAEGLAAFNEVGWMAMLKAVVGLTVLAFGLMKLAVPIAVAGSMVAIPLMMLGVGLLIFAYGLKAYNDVSWMAIVKAVAGLYFLTSLLSALTVPIMVIGSLVAIPLILMAIGLFAFALALKQFNDVGLSAIPAAVTGLYFLTMMLASLALPIFVIGNMVAIPLLWMALGLFGFAIALKQFNDVGLSAIPAAVAGLWLLTWSLAKLAIPIFVIGNMVAIPLLMMALGLFAFAIALQQFNNVGIGAIPIAVAGLWLLVLSLFKLVVPLAVVGTMVAMPLLMLSAGLFGFALSMQQFNGVAATAIPAMAASLFLLGVVLAKVGVPLIVIAPMIWFALMQLGAGLFIFATGLAAFNNVGMGAILIAITALTLFGLAMAWFIMTGILAAMIVGFQLLAIPLMMFGAGLFFVGLGLLMIQAGIPGLMALSSVLEVIAAIALSGAVAMGVLAASIMGIAFALMFIPVEKAIAFSMSMDSYGAAMAAVASLTPESVEAAEAIVETARQYVEVQAEMQSPDEDAFLQALKQVFGGGEGGEGGGRDIVLKLDNREFARAVDAAITSTHSLSID